MNFMKRAFLYVSRKRGKSILLFFILLILSTFVLTGLSIGSASKQAQKNLRQKYRRFFPILMSIIQIQIHIITKKKVRMKMGLPTF